MPIAQIPLVSVAFKREEIEVTSDGTLPPFEPDYAKKFVSGPLTVHVTIDGEEFILSEDEYIDVLRKWAKILRTARE